MLIVDAHSVNTMKTIHWSCGPSIEHILTLIQFNLFGRFASSSLFLWNFQFPLNDQNTKILCKMTLDTVMEPPIRHLHDIFNIIFFSSVCSAVFHFTKLKVFRFRLVLNYVHTHSSIIRLLP